MNKSEKIYLLTMFILFSLLIACVVYYAPTLENRDKKEINIDFFKKEVKNEIKEKLRNKKEIEIPIEEVKKQIQTPQEEPIKQIFINPPSQLSYKTKQEVYDIRKRYIMRSIFANKSYEPSEEVFGQIESNKPWVSYKLCLYKDSNTADIKGPSEEARFINNPTLLVALEYAFYGHYCENFSQNFITTQFPIEIKYDTKNKEITTVYTYLPYCNKQNNIWYSFKGLNARDLGYKYAYLDLEKSTFKPHFQEEINISNSIIEFKDFIHVGGSCGVSGGCNNASPNQPPLNFFYPCTGEDGIKVKDRTLYLKLWKERPSSPQQEADITQKIIIRSLKLKQGE